MASSLDLPPGPEPSYKQPQEKKFPDIIPAILPAGEVHLLSGASGAGKTALTFQLLSAMFSGQSFFGLSPRKPSFIGYIAADRRWESHEAWLRTVGLSSLPHYSMIQDMETSGHAIRKGTYGDRFQLFRRCIAKLCISEGFTPKDPLKSLSSVDTALLSLPPDSFLVIDPVSLFIGGDLNKYDQSYSHMLDLNQFCMRYNCTILGIAHAGKQKSDPTQRYTRPQDRIVGTTAQTGCSSTVMHLAPESEVGKAWSEFAYVPHNAVSGGFKLVRDPSNGLFVVYDGVTATQPETDKKVKSLNTATEKLLRFFPTDYTKIHYKELPGKSDLSLSQVYRYLEVLKDCGEIEPIAGNPAGYWKRKAKD